MALLIVLVKYLHGHNLHNLHVVINHSKGFLSLFCLGRERVGTLFQLTFILMHVFSLDKTFHLVLKSARVRTQPHGLRLFIAHRGPHQSSLANIQIHFSSLDLFLCVCVSVCRWTALSQDCGDVLKNWSERTCKSVRR